ncbi:MAG: hypothetical protein JSR17_08335 [Proteobacteria bacterium]|nr:hypothetical protein [Pseudomonadota bacterium]
MGGNQIKNENDSQDFTINALLIYIGLTISLWFSFFLTSDVKFIHIKDIIFSLLMAFGLTSLFIIFLWIMIEIIWAILGLFANPNRNFLLLARQVCVIGFIALLVSGGACFFFILIR